MYNPSNATRSGMAMLYSFPKFVSSRLFILFTISFLWLNPKLHSQTVTGEGCSYIKYSVPCSDGTRYNVEAKVGFYLTSSLFPGDKFRVISSTNPDYTAQVFHGILSTQPFRLLISSKGTEIENIRFTGEVANDPSLNPTTHSHASISDNGHRNGGNQALVPQIMSSIAADGSTNKTTKFKIINTETIINCEFPNDRDLSLLRIRIAGGHSADIIGSIDAPSYYRDSVVFYYNHPKYKTNNSPQTVDFELYKENCGSTATLVTFPVKIVQPGLLMMHGLNSSGAEFSNLSAFFQGQGYKTSQLYAPSYANDSSFEANGNVVKNGVTTLLNQLKADKISATKVDIVAHSMGGLLSRQYLQGEGASRKDVNRLITCNSPHSGSPVANYLREESVKGTILRYIAAGLNALGGIAPDPNSDAVRDLAIGSDALNILNHPSSLRNNTVPSHVIHTTQSYALVRAGCALAPRQLGRIPYVGIPLEVFSRLACIGAGPIISEEIFKDEFGNPDTHDLIVTTQSQMGGLSHLSYVSNQSHVGMTKNSQVQNRLKTLLQSDPLGSDFSRSGYNPVPLTYSRDGVPPMPTDEPILSTSIQIDPSLKGRRVRKGETITINLILGSGISSVALLTSSTASDSLEFMYLDAAPYSFSYTIPNDFEDMVKLMIFAQPNSTTVLSDSSYVLIGTCFEPTNLTATNITTNSATINWAAAEAAVSYKVEYKTAAASTWTTANAAVVGTSYSLTGLSASTAYHVRLTTNCASETSNPSATLNFSTVNPACIAPSTPSVSNIISNAATLSWAAASGAVSYKIEFKQTADATWLVANAAYVGTNFTLSGLSASTNYQARVSTNCAVGSSGASNDVSFTTNGFGGCDPTSQPTITNLTATGATINWTLVIDAQSYQVEYKTAAATTWSTLPITGRTFQTMGGLSPSTSYQVRVYTNCSAGTSPPTATTTFTTLDPPCIPPTTPTANEVTAYTATIHWTAVLGAVAYRIEYKPLAATNWISLANTTNLSQVLTGLTASTPYNVRVYTVCRSALSAASPVLNFATLPPPSCPDPNLPSVSNLTASSALISWETPAGVQSHRVEFKRTADATWTVWSEAVSGTFTTISGLASNTFYDVRTFTNCGAIVGTNYSEIVTFRTLAPICNPASTPSVSSVTTSAATVTWATVSGATAYRVEYKRNADATWTALANTSNTSASLSSLSASTVYNVRVSVICSGGTGAPSTVVNFTTSAAATCDATSTPSVSAISSSSATISWVAINGATAYRLEYKATASATWASLTTSNTEAELTGLAAATSYHVRVFTICATLSSTASPIADFTSLPSGFVCNSTSTPSVSNILSAGATISWTAALGGIAYRVEYKLATASTWTQMPNTGRTTQALTGLEPSSLYQVRVVTVCDGATSAPSTIVNFTTLAAPCTATGSPLATNATESSVSISWTAVAGAVSYRVDYKLNTASNWTTLPNTSNNSLVITGLSPLNIYNVRVFTICTSSISDASPIITFATTASTFCPNPNTPYITNITNTRAIVNWENPNNTESHRVEYKRASDANWIVWVAEEFSTSSQIVGLTMGTTYQVRTFLSCGARTGAEYSPIVTFTTLGGSCPTPTSPSVSNITTSGATVSWATVLSAVSYKVEYKTTTASTWTTVVAALTATSYNLMGLAAGTAYQVQVTTNCSSSSSSPSPITNFTTTANPSDCAYSFEPNNTFETAATIPVNAVHSASILTSSDIDYYKLTLTSAEPNLTVYLSRLGSDFDLYLYNASRTVVAFSTISGTGMEQLNGVLTAGTYYLRVQPKTTGSSLDCYHLTVLADNATPYCLRSGLIENPKMGQLRVLPQKGSSQIMDVLGLGLYPNPAQAQVTAQIWANQEGTHTIVVMDILGKAHIVQNVLLLKGENQLSLRTAELPKGLYTVRISKNQTSVVRKLIIQ
jgi:pimeloyl-ACP methyl ester carboxylesterase